MAGDRDIGVAFARALPSSPTGGRTGWEMTAATGVRGLRLLAESGAFAHFTLSEANPEAAAVLRSNAARFPGAQVLEADARLVPLGAPFDYVDLDPYGTPAPFARTALQSVRSGGVVAVTATDMMVLAGAQPSACRQRYGARPVRGRLGPEGGLRILLGYLSREAESLGRSLRPMLAYAKDHYVRAYVEVGEGSSLPAPVATIDPAAWSGPELGDRGPYGPLWVGPLFDAAFVSRLEAPSGAARPREVEGFFSRLREEVTADRPFYFEANVLASRLDLPVPPGLAAILEGLRSLGYRAARTHARPEGFRTDAPRDVVEALVRRLALGSQSQNTRVRA
jgi:tRNA (guanine26-N2/guanine27-N2)-dimethyltransferase